MKVGFFGVKILKCFNESDIWKFHVFICGWKYVKLRYGFKISDYEVNVKNNISGENVC